MDTIGRTLPDSPLWTILDWYSVDVDWQKRLTDTLPFGMRTLP